MIKIDELNKIFIEVNGEGIVTQRSNFISDLVLKSSHVDCPDKAKRLFFGSRMFFRIKELNRALKDQSIRGKRKWKKITS